MLQGWLRFPSITECALPPPAPPYPVQLTALSSTDVVILQGSVVCYKESSISSLFSLLNPICVRPLFYAIVAGPSSSSLLPADQRTSNTGIATLVLGR